MNTIQNAPIQPLASYEVINNNPAYPAGTTTTVYSTGTAPSVYPSNTSYPAGFVSGTSTTAMYSAPLTQPTQYQTVQPQYVQAGTLPQTQFMDHPQGIPLANQHNNDLD